MNGNSLAFASTSMTDVPPGAQLELFPHGCGLYSLPADDVLLLPDELPAVDAVTQPLFH